MKDHEILELKKADLFLRIIQTASQSRLTRCSLLNMTRNLILHRDILNFKRRVDEHSQALHTRFETKNWHKAEAWPIEQKLPDLT